MYNRRSAADVSYECVDSGLPVDGRQGVIKSKGHQEHNLEVDVLFVERVGSHFFILA